MDAESAYMLQASIEKAFSQAGQDLAELGVGSILAYLKEQKNKEITDSTAKQLLQIFASQVPAECQQLHLQVRNKIYRLAEDGLLHTEDCQDQLQILAAQEELQSNSPEAAANPASKRSLFVQLANVAKGDRLRLHLQAQLKTITVDLPHEDPQHCGPVAFNLPLPLHAKPVTAVEQLRGIFASPKANLPADPRLILYQVVHLVSQAWMQTGFGPACFAEHVPV